jgi:hypothetical protein
MKPVRRLMKQLEDINIQINENPKRGVLIAKQSIQKDGWFLSKTNLYLLS